MSRKSTVFGEHLKNARLKSGLSQRRLGIEIGLVHSVASARMNQYEVGSHHPNYQTAQAIASVLNVPTAYLFCDDQLLSKVIEGWSKLNQGQKDQVVGIVEAIVSNKNTD